MNIKELKAKVKEQEKNTIKSVECQDILELHNRIITKVGNQSGSFEDKQGKTIEYDYDIIEVKDEEDNYSYYKVTDKEVVKRIEIGKEYNIGLLYSVYKSISNPKVIVIDIEEVTTK